MKDEDLNDFDLAEHRRKFACFYLRAHPLEIEACDLIGRLKTPVTRLLNSQCTRDPNGPLPPFVINNLEAAFTVAVRAVRMSPTFRALSLDDRELFEREAFLIEFENG